LKFYYKKGKTATQAAKKIFDTYGHDASKETKISDLFSYLRGSYTIQNCS